MSDKLTVHLGEIQQSMLVAVYLRALETQRPDRLVCDLKALEIVDRVDFNFESLTCPLSFRLDSALRAELLDERVRHFISEHPEGMIVNLGSGLDGRFWRVDNGRIQWFDVDMPDSLVVRRQFFEEGPRNRFLSGSMFDEGWIDQLSRSNGQPLLLIAEGVLVFFPEPKIRELFRKIADRLPGAEMLFWSVGLGAGRQVRKRGVTRQMLPDFRWEIASGAEVVAWDPRIQFVREWPLIDRHPERWPPARRWLVKIPRLYQWLRGTLKITHVRFAEANEAAMPPMAKSPSAPRSLIVSTLSRIDASGFVIGFLTSMMAAGRGRVWLGPLVVIAVVALRLARDPNPRGAFWLIGLVTILGFAIDTGLSAAGIVTYYPRVWLLGLCPLWTIFLWINFSAKLTNLNRHLYGRYWLATAVGALVTPLAYIVGQKVGALQLGPGPLSAPITLALIGAVLLPACLWLTAKLHGASSLHIPGKIR